jgi:nucleoside-diphosphate-sugar epimerase
MNILITGNKGFVGTETQKYFESQDLTVFGYDIMEDHNDIRDLARLESFVVDNKIDRILHLAAIARFADADKDPQLAFETNVLGTKNVAEVAKKYHIPVVYSSTGSVYMPITDFTGAIKEDWTAKGNSVYGCTKFAGETYIRECSPYIILRYAHLYGKEKRMHGLIGGFADRISRGLAPTLYGGKQSNDFTYIKDIARANYLAITAPWDKWNQIYNIGTGEELSAEKAGKDICKALGWPEDKVEVKEARTVDPERFWFDCTKAKTMLNFEPEYTFAKGLEDMFKKEEVKV